MLGRSRWQQTGARARVELSELRLASSAYCCHTFRPVESWGGSLFPYGRWRTRGTAQKVTYKLHRIATSGKGPTCQYRRQTLVRSRGPKDPLEEYSYLENPMDRGARGAIQSIGSPRVGHDWRDSTHREQGGGAFAVTAILPNVWGGVTRGLKQSVQRP